MSTYTKEHIKDIVPLVQTRAELATLLIEDQQDLVQETVVEVLLSNADNRESMLRVMNNAFRRHLRKISRHNKRVVTRSLTIQF